MICDTLSTSLSSPALASHLESPPFISGVVFGVSAAPEIPMPEAWMPWVLAGPHEHPLQQQDVDNLANGLIAQLQWQLGVMRDDKALLPVQCEWSEHAGQRQTLEQWLTGVLLAHGKLESVWELAWTNHNVPEAESRLRRCLKCFSILAKSEATVSSLPEDKATSLQSNLPVLYQQLGGLLSDYVTLAGELASQLPGQFDTYTKKV